MKRSHFRYFFETYFNYPYEKLDIWTAGDAVHEEIATSYECSMYDVDCFFLFTRMMSGKEIQHYGFYRIKDSDFYMPFFTYCSKETIVCHVELAFNYDINNSVFDCKHIPLKKEKTDEFYSFIMDNLQPLTKKILKDSNIFTLTESFKKSFIYFDFDMSCYTIEVTNRGKNFNEFFSIKWKIGDLIDNKIRVFDPSASCHYHLKYTVDKKIDQLIMTDSSNSIDALNFNKDELLMQSFSGMTGFVDFNYSTIDGLASLVQEYRQVESMYSIK